MTRRFGELGLRWSQGWLASAVIALTGQVGAQVSWSGGYFAPTLARSSCVYDPIRDRLVMFGDPGFPQPLVTLEYDRTVHPGLAWQVATWTAPSMGQGYYGGSGYDRTSHKVVVSDGKLAPPAYGTTWTWDGTSWAVAATGVQLAFEHVFEHVGRGTVMGFGGGNTLPATDLYEWNGTAWNLLPVAARPPRPFVNSTYFFYRSGTYDARRDRIVLFGTATWDGVSPWSRLTPTVWEWSQATGWTSPTVAFPWTVTAFVRAYFNWHRGTIMANAYDPLGVWRLFEWDGGPQWREIPLAATVPPGWGPDSITDGYDPVSGRLYSTFNFNNLYSVRAQEHVNPAEFAVHGTGCVAGQSKLDLLHPWTRAWMGRSLELEMTNLPQSLALLALGWSDTQSGTTPLPVSLTSLGMPGCFARVGPDSVHFASGSNGRASLAFAVPSNAALMGVPLFAQAYAPDPAANALGVTLTNSVRLTVGHL